MTLANADRAAVTGPQNNERPRLKDQQMSTEVLHEREQVRADDDGRAGRGSLDDRILESADATRIEAGERLVEQDRAGFMQVGASDRDFLRMPRESSWAIVSRFSVSSKSSSNPVARSLKSETRYVAAANSRCSQTVSMSKSLGSSGT